MNWGRRMLNPTAFEIGCPALRCAAIPQRANQRVLDQVVARLPARVNGRRRSPEAAGSASTRSSSKF